LLTSRIGRLGINAIILALLLGPRADPALGQPAACDGDGRLPDGCGNILFDGDSIAAGVGASPNQPPDQQFLRGLGRPARLANVAAGGRPVSECLQLFPMTVAPRHSTAARFNLIVFHAGDNDIAQGRDSATAYAAFTAYVAAAHKQGWMVLVSTELPRPNFSAPREAYLEDYNKRLIANGAGADGVVDLSVERRLTDLRDRADSGYYVADKVHLNDAGYARLTQRLLDAARRLLPQ
jgi:lysophospholipase L1-like esterase